MVWTYLGPKSLQSFLNQTTFAFEIICLNVSFPAGEKLLSCTFSSVIIGMSTDLHPLWGSWAQQAGLPLLWIWSTAGWKIVILNMSVSLSCRNCSCSPSQLLIWGRSEDEQPRSFYPSTLLYFCNFMNVCASGTSCESRAALELFRFLFISVHLQPAASPLMTSWCFLIELLLHSNLSSSERRLYLITCS